MSYAIAAAGTGGHVFPGLAVGEALVESGVERSEILFVGGDRLESSVYPEQGFPFFEVEIRGLRRSLSLSNLALPIVMIRAVTRLRGEFRRRGVRVVLGMGGYVTPPAALAARTTKAKVVVSEQNAEAGLGSRLASRVASRSFGAFPRTEGIPHAEWVGNPLRSMFSRFDRGSLRGEALKRYDLISGLPVLGVFGGSLGAGAINDGVARLVAEWNGPPIQILHLCGECHVEKMNSYREKANLTWRLVGFEDRMDLFYAASDLVVSRSGGAVAELLATGTPSILVPGIFGSGRHQVANAESLASGGASIVLKQEDLASLGVAVHRILEDQGTLHRMAEAALEMGRPDSASIVAEAMRSLHE